MNSIKEMIENTINFLGTSAGITIIILLIIILIQFLIIWLLIWIIKNQFNKNSGVNQMKGGIQ
jgi:hypothetical protein